MRRSTSIYIPTSHFSNHTEITLQDVPNRQYMLRLFVENVERELQKTDDHTWTPAQRQYVFYFPHTYTHWWMCMYRDVSPTSQIRTEVRMKIGNSIWTKYRVGSGVIDLDRLFNEYWSSNDHDFIVLGQSLSPTDPCRSDCGEQRPLSLENIVGL